jgi:pyruvate dehydrogenase (quinone)
VLAHRGPALLDLVTDPRRAVDPAAHHHGARKGFALAATGIMLDGGAGRVLGLAGANVRNISRPAIAR